jgi:hypothetical protein
VTRRHDQSFLIRRRQQSFLEDERCSQSGFHRHGVSGSVGNHQNIIHSASINVAIQWIFSRSCRALRPELVEQHGEPCAALRKANANYWDSHILICVLELLI